MSRFISAFFIASRLSCSFFPLHNPTSNLAIPRWLKYIRSGTSVSPFSCALPANLRNSRLWRSNFRGRFGSWFQMLACTYSGISAPTNHTSSSRTRAYDSSNDSLPFLRLLTSLPTRAIPHSSVSSTSNLCRALRFSAIGRESVGFALGFFFLLLAMSD